MVGFESEPTLFQWHEDAFTLPKDVPSLGGSLIYPNQAFRMNAWTYGFQFHFEVDEKMIAGWVRKGQAELRKVKGYIVPKKIKEETELFASSMKRMAWRFYENLFEYLGHLK
jgi:GMP synthase (glutamine-hydrolysing)